MYERMQQDVGNELSKLVGYSACICRGFGMPSDAEDVLQDVFRSMSETGRRNPKFAATVCSMPSEELHAYVKKAIRNAARRLSEKSEADARKRRAWAEERAVCGRTGPAPDVAQAWDKDNALRVLRLVTAKLDNAPLETALSQILPAKLDYSVNEEGVIEIDLKGPKKPERPSAPVKKTK